MKRAIMAIMAVTLLYGGHAAIAADEKIDPASYICAQFVASAIDGQPPIFEALQLDGYAAAKSGHVVADPNSLETIMLGVYDSCSAKPGDKAIEHWQQARRQLPFLDEGAWRADVTKCADYKANPDDGSGFVIWLDGYQRGKTGKDASVFVDQASLDNFIAVCQSSPERLMFDVMVENAK